MWSQKPPVVVLDLCHLKIFLGEHVPRPPNFSAIHIISTPLNFLPLTKNPVLIPVRTCNPALVWEIAQVISCSFQQPGMEDNLTVHYSSYYPPVFIQWPSVSLFRFELGTVLYTQYMYLVSQIQQCIYTLQCIS